MSFEYGTIQRDGTDFKPKVDDVIETTIGDFGKWQCRISILMSLLKFPIAWFQLGIVFLAPPTNFWCRRPEQYQNTSVEDWIKLIKPMGNITKHEGLAIGSCLMRSLDDPQKNVPCQWGYEYNKTVVHSSIITEWDLVCGRERLVDVSQIILMLGVLIGNILCGITADKFGRKIILMWCLIFQTFWGILSAWTPCFWGFLVFRFLLAVANGGTMTTSFVMCMEVVGGKWRTIIPILYQIPFGLGNSIMAGLAFVIRDWRELQCAISVISSLYIMYLWFIPESPRWLLAVGRKTEMVKVLEKAAIYNGIDPSIVKANLGEDNAKNTPNKLKFSTIFTHKKLRVKTFLMCINWCICGITFYAFSQYLGQISRNLYLTVAVGGLIAIPGTLFCVYIIRRSGRRWTVTWAHLVTAACFFSILVIPRGIFYLDWPRVGFAALGIIGMSVSMPALYLFTGELYPTVVRNAGVGTSVMFSRIGSMIAPLVTALHDVIPYLPLLMLGILAVIEALLVLPLPETKGIVLPETLEDLEDNNNKSIQLKVMEKGKYVSVPNQEDR